MATIDYTAAAEYLTDADLLDLQRRAADDDSLPRVATIRAAREQWARHGEVDTGVWACVRAIVDAYEGDPAASEHTIVRAAYGVAANT